MKAFNNHINKGLYDFLLTRPFITFSFKPHEN
jgi:hypothetical protein